MSKLLAIASGKGGVGKTSLTLNMAASAAKQGKRVLVFDGDFGLANVDVQLGVTPEHDLADVLAGQCALKNAIFKAELADNVKFDIIAGRSGADNLPFMTQLEQRGVLHDLQELALDYDVIFLDVPAGLDTTVLGLCSAADDIWIVTTPDPSSITDSYALLKLLAQRENRKDAKFILNQITSGPEGTATAKKLQLAAKSFLGLDAEIIAQVPAENTYRNAVKTQKLAVQIAPHGKVAEVLERLVKTL